MDSDAHKRNKKIKKTISTKIDTNTDAINGQCRDWECMAGKSYISKNRKTFIIILCYGSHEHFIKKATRKLNKQNAGILFVGIRSFSKFKTLG